MKRLLAISAVLACAPLQAQQPPQPGIAPVTLAA
jgi:hypothetical protein